MDIFQHLLEKHDIRTRGEFVDAAQLAAALGGNAQTFWDEISADSGFIDAFQEQYPNSDMFIKDANCLWLHPVLASIATHQWNPQHAISISRRLRMEMVLEEQYLEN
ncbi:MAG: hypothetical protein AB4040_14400 [Synechococcus sp.]